MGMRYSERVQSVVKFSRQEAARLGHEHISTGHLLLGLLREGEGTAIAFLESANIDLERMKTQVEGVMENKGRGPVIGKLKITSRADSALKMAAEEAENMGHKYIGTEHLLIGLIREEEGVAAKTLIKLGVDVEKSRSAAQVITIEEDANSEVLTFNNAEITVPILEHSTEYSAGVSESEVLDLEEASQFLKITVDEMTELLEKEKMPARKIGGQWRFSRSALIKWLGEGSSQD